MADDDPFKTGKIDLSKLSAKSEQAKKEMLKVPPPKPAAKPAPKPAAATPTKLPELLPTEQPSASKHAEPAKAVPPAVPPAEQPAAEVAGRFPLSDEAKPLLQEGQAVGAFLDVLTKEKHWIDAVRLLAHALPKREGVWWACRCARSVAGPEPETAAALQAAEKWVVDPSEENRRVAFPAAEAAQFSNPAACAALAAFWSGGSLGPPNVPVIPPGEYFTAMAVANAVLLAAVATEPEKAPERYGKFLQQGLAIGAGADRWK